MFALIGPNIRSLSKSFFTIIIDVIAQWIIRITFTFSENNLEKNIKKNKFPKKIQNLEFFQKISLDEKTQNNLLE